LFGIAGLDGRDDMNNFFFVFFFSWKKGKLYMMSDEQKNKKDLVTDEMGCFFMRFFSS